ncbi:MAG TPA: methionine adenosyltransferase [Myxococcales bacterium]|jgi:S-adenosylmethionine synthetase|nr:methionine adenosyltransferase [Myxococcales bacterium]
MQLRDALFSSESVTEGHPDKVCDQISDAVLDECLRQDKHSRVALETAVKTGLVVLLGEITTKATLKYPEIVRRTVERIGFNDGAMGFDSRSVGVMVAVEQQSPEISMGVDSDANKEQGAGDQGMMFGYACDETEELMPLPIALAHRLTRELAKARRGDLKFLRPDGKSQVSVEYKDGKPHKVQAVVIATQHEDSVSTEHLREAVNAEIIDKVIPKELRAPNMKRMINATGRFIIGGPMGDSGVTGRKIIVDTYGGMGHHGGGAFSGKDPSKVDRSAAYAGRWVAKNVVKAGLAKRCEVQVAYAIGVAEPVSILVETFGTHAVSEEQIEKAVRATFSLKPASIIKDLDLLRPIYEKTAAYGHFGRSEPEFTWEHTDRVQALRQAAGLK